MVPRPTQHQTTEYPLRRIQDYVAGAFMRLAVAIPFLDGGLLEDVVLTTTALKVAHKLGRTPRGVIVVNAIGTGAIGAVMTDAVDASNVTLRLSTGSSPATYKLWVW